MDFRTILKLAFISWTLFGGAGAYMLTFHGDSFRGSFTQAYLLFLLPPILLGISLYRLLTTDKALQEFMLNSAGVSRHSHLAFIHDRSGIAINPQARTLTLMERGVIRTYPFSQFRGYRTYFQPRPYHSEGLRNVSGLFIDIADGLRPQWKIGMFYQADQHRWAQILDLEFGKDREAA